MPFPGRIGPRRKRARAVRIYSPSDQIAVLPQGSARPVAVTGRPISSAETAPPKRGFKRTPSRYAITDGESPVV